MRAMGLVFPCIVACSAPSPPPTPYPFHSYGAGTQQGAPWPMLSHDVGGSGRAPIPAASSGQVRWTAVTGAFIGTASPVVAADGTVYVGNSAGALTALHPDGKQAWQTNVGGGIEGAPAVALDGSVYVGADDARLHVVSPSGVDSPSHNGVDSIRSSLLLDDRETAFFVGDWSGCSASLGSLVSCDLPASAGPTDRLPFAIADGHVYMATGFLLEAFGTDPINGDAGTPVAQGRFGAVLEDGTTFVVTNGRIEAHDASGNYLWACDIPIYDYAFETRGLHVAVSNAGLVYVEHPTGVMLLSSAGSVWSVDVGATLSGELAIGADGTVYFGADDGNLYAYDAFGHLVFVVKTGGPVRSSPAIGADGTVYIGSDDGLLYAVGP